VTIVASGNYVGGTIWPPLVNWERKASAANQLYRHRHFCAVAMTIVLLLRAQIGAPRGVVTRTRRAARRSAGSVPIR